MKSIKNYILALILSICSSFLFIAHAQYNIPEKPVKKTEQTSVYDYAKLLSASEKSNLENKLIKYADTTSTQIVVVIINTTKGESIGILTPRWAHKWGVGQADKDNGVFILLAKDDRKIWISPGYEIEEKLTAGVNGELIRNVIIPEFKKGSYYNGLDKGTTAIIEILNGTYSGSRQSNSSDNNGFPIAFVVLLFIIFIIIMISLSKRKGGGNHDSFGGGKRQEGLSPLDIIILSRAGRSSGGFLGGGSYGGGGGFSGGGGFGGGFGGGGFSGGGAGGSW